MVGSAFFNHLNLSKTQLMETFQERQKIAFPSFLSAKTIQLLSDSAKSYDPTMWIPSGKSQITERIFANMSVEAREKIRLYSPHSYGRSIDIVTDQNFDMERFKELLYLPYIGAETKVREQVKVVPLKPIDYRYRSVREAINNTVYAKRRLSSLHALRLINIGRFSTRTSVLSDFYGNANLKPKGYGLREMVDEIRSKKST